MGNNNQPAMSNDQDPEHSVIVDDFKLNILLWEQEIAGSNSVTPTFN